MRRLAPSSARVLAVGESAQLAALICAALHRAPGAPETQPSTGAARRSRSDRQRLARQYLLAQVDRAGVRRHPSLPTNTTTTSQPAIGRIMI
uniref:Uncharacterized protein n=1 Tax=Plectus sambesii TaxID=2011161 RepID=A0A914WU11_9BILA